jgi:hypothetical protein
MQSETTIPGAPPVQFKLSEETIQKNTELLRSCDLDLQTLLSWYQDTTLGFGSKFSIMSTNGTDSMGPEKGLHSHIIKDGANPSVLRHIVWGNQGMSRSASCPSSCLSIYHHICFQSRVPGKSLEKAGGDSMAINPCLQWMM